MNKRKQDHIDISKAEDVSSSYNYWDDVHLVHDALPEVDMDEVDTTWRAFGAEMQAPILVAGMTGGCPDATSLNRRLAAVAERYGVGMGVGSQRVALEDEEAVESYRVVTEFDVPLVLANIGAPQLLEWPDAVETAARAVEMVEADVLAVHLNFLQECIQVEGDRRARGVLDELRMLAASLSTPVVVKETGAGVSRDVAARLCETDVAGVDVGGMSGTSCAATEAHRARKRGDRVQERLGHLFRDWGIPTPLSVLETADVCRDTGMVVIATGGVRTGLDVARAIALGADAAGMAAAFLDDDPDEVFETATRALKTAMFLTGCRTLDELREVDVWMR